MRSMKIAMMARNPELYSHRRLKEAAEERGYQLDIINTLRCYMNIASRRPEIYYNGDKLTGYDAVIPRIGASVTFYGLAVLRQFEMMGVYPLNESVAIGRSRDKLRSMQLLARDGIGLPVTTFAHDPKMTEEVLSTAGGAPVVIKLLEGTQGIGVVLADTERSAKSVIEAFRGANVNILVQEFIKEAGWLGYPRHCRGRQGDRSHATHRALKVSSAQICIAGAVPNPSRSRRKSAQPPCGPPRRWG